MINYDIKFKQWVKKNLEIVKQSTNEEWLKLKVRNFVEKHGTITVEELLKQIKENDWVASFFAKDPSKQGIHEKTAAEYLKTFFKDLQILPKSGKNAKYVVNGSVVSNRPNKTYKSIDFTFSHMGYTIYASHKYTNESGGAQDHQRNDLISFVEHSAKPINKKHIFIAIADGKYYTKNNNANLKHINQSSIDKKVFACGSSEIKNKLDYLLKK